jgi:hypothetical protein
VVVGEWMRIVGEYLAKAAVFEALSATASSTERKHYADLASYYRKLAQERRWMLATQDLKAHVRAAGVPAE